jgi:eukaryotic-like serine/threonine-protein kinase
MSVPSEVVTSTNAALPGVLLDGRYRVGRLLARGGMSAVYRGVDTRLDRPVAIKVMDQRYAGDASFLRRFEQEARAAARLHHPNVVAMHDQGVDNEHGDVAFLVMELVDGGTLRDLLEQYGALEVDLAAGIIESVLHALAGAHAAGLVHRDIKPENVLIGPAGADRAAGGVVKVADFGLVRAMAGASVTSSSVILGTVAYLSPEQVTSGMATARSDVYSAGILLYEMLTGHPPYTGDTPLSVAYRHVNDDVPAPSSTGRTIPAPLDRLVGAATSRAPEARPADARAFLTELTRVRTELGLRPVPVPVPDAPDTDQSSSGLPDSEGADAATGPVSAPAAAGPTGTRALRRQTLETPAEPLGADASQSGDSAAGTRGRGRRVALWLTGLLLLGALLGAGALWYAGANTVVVPDVIGMDQPRAESVLGEAELAAQVVRERHNTVPVGTVIRTDPQEGTELRRGSAVDLVVSLGRPTVPDIERGMALEDAQSAIADAQLTPVRDEGADAYHPSVPEGMVLEVSPQPGTQLYHVDRAMRQAFGVQLDVFQDGWAAWVTETL